MSAYELSLLPPEIITIVLEHLPLKDLVRAERTSKLIQAFCLREIQRRITTGPLKDDFGVMVHLGQTTAQPLRFDPKTKQVYYSVPMNPVEIRAMFDHGRQIHCSLLRRKTAAVAAAAKASQTTVPTKKPKYLIHDGFSIKFEKGMIEGETVQVSIKSQLCQVEAALTRLAQLPSPEQDSKKKLCLAPQPLTYTLQLTEMRLPLSTIAAA
ncbi:hypothetical protein DFQ28_007573 [Apophysomyces sp. BC1034]|nr:hypothetical protein DFQ30_003170 [Apophysomyces sp. BC1015]KAG0182156.1 hypothetical protein DFQ29_005516 [Apophysomyces sp. BC1021]KAG0192813.1 hypothetical protein DFQ28_007573 [Apophysomyces sp. BC1034]